MAKYRVQFAVRKGSSEVLLSKDVEAENEYMAVQYAEGQLKSAHSIYRNGHDWNVRSVSKK